MNMRPWIDLVEERDSAFGEALWINPSGGVIPIDDEHPDCLRAYGSTAAGPSGAELLGDDANFHAIRRGWARVVIFGEGARTFIAARDWHTAKRGVRELVRLKWSNRDSEVSLDIYGDDPNQPDQIRAFGSPSELFRA